MKEAGRKTMVRYEICFIAELSRTVAVVSVMVVSASPELARLVIYQTTAAYR